MHIYIFGSVCRGEVDLGSDVDLLAIVDGYDNRFDLNQYSIYTISRLKEIWQQGNPFAWHLSLEAKLIFSEDGENLLKNLGNPNKYKLVKKDCEKFYKIFNHSVQSLSKTTYSTIFDLSTIFLAIRNFSTCYSLGMTDNPDFSRNSAKMLGDFKIPIANNSYEIYERARILCTRGAGKYISSKEIILAKKDIHIIDSWMINLLKSIG